MGREELADDGGMLFVFPKPSVYPFWMKNTLIPLDIIWLDPDFNVVHISENLQPCMADPCPVTNPGVEALYVLELNAGAANRAGLEPGSAMKPNRAVLAAAKQVR